MSYLRRASNDIPSNGIPSYSIKDNSDDDNDNSYNIIQDLLIQDFVIICLTISMIVFSFIILHTMKRNKEIERELTTVNANIKLLRNEFQQKINEVEAKNNSALKNIRQSHEDLEYMLDNHVMDIELTEKNIQQKISEIERQNTPAFENINQELGDFQDVVKTGFSEIISRQNTFNGHLEGNFNVLSNKIAKNISEQNSLERQVNQITDQLIQQQQVIQNTENRCKRFDAFLDNYAIKTFNGGYNANYRLNEPSIISIYQISGNNAVECNIFRTLSGIGTKFNVQHVSRRNEIRQYLESMSNRYECYNMSLVQDKYVNDGNVSDLVPIYMLCLLFGTKIFSVDDEDVTDLYESNFNNAKRYHDARASSNPESKRISDMCNVEIVREMFK